MALPEPRRGDAHEAAVAPHLAQGRASRIAHRRAQAAGELVDHLAQGALERHPPLDPLRDELQPVGDLLLEVAVRRAARHGAERAHAAVGLVGAPLVEEDVAGAFLGAGEKRADHRAVGARGDRLGEVAGELDAAVGDHRDPVAARRLHRIEDRRELGHADAGDHAGGADRAGADADLDRVGAGIDQGARAGAGRDVAGRHLDAAAQRLDRRDRAGDRFAVAMRRVDHDEVAAGLEQRLGPAQPVGTDAGRRADPQPALAVLAGEGMGLGAFDVLDRDQPDAAIGVVHHQELLDPVPVEKPPGRGAVHVLADGDQVVGGHDLADRPVGIGLETDVAVGQDADQAPAAGLDHRNPGDAVLLLQPQRLAHRAVGRDGERVDDHAGFELLDPAHLLRLRRRLHVLVDDAKAAHLRHGDGQPALGDGIHRRGQQRDAEGDRFRHPGFERGPGRQHRGRGGFQRYVVEGEGFSNLHRGPGSESLRPIRLPAYSQGSSGDDRSAWEGARRRGSRWRPRSVRTTPCGWRRA